MLFFILCRKEFGRHSSLQWLLWGNHQRCFTGCFFPKCRWDVLVWKVSHKLCQWPNSGMLGPTYREFSLSLADSAVSSDQAAQGFTKSSPENPQGWALPKWSGALFHCLVVLRVKFGFPYIQSEPFLFQFMPIVSCPPAMHDYQEWGSIFSVTSL